jgi:hypothetical protein
MESVLPQTPMRGWSILTTIENSFSRNDPSVGDTEAINAGCFGGKAIHKALRSLNNTCSAGLFDCEAIRAFRVQCPFRGHSLQGRPGDKVGHVRYAAKSGSKSRDFSGFAISDRDLICPRRDSSSKSGASNHAVRTQRLRMDRHQTDAAQQAERHSAGK